MQLPVRDALQFFGARRSRLSMHEQLRLLLITSGVPLSGGNLSATNLGR